MLKFIIKNTLRLGRKFMLKFIVYCPIFILLVSCAVSDNTLGKGKFNIRLWRDNTPNFLRIAGDDIMTLNIDKENVIEFDTKIVGDSIYLLYTTDVQVYSARKANTVIDDPVLRGSITANDWIENYNVVTSLTKKIISYQRGSRNASGNLVLGVEQINKQENRDLKGVWVRILKGTISGNSTSSTLRWQQVYSSDTPIEISNPKLILLNLQDIGIVAVRNQNRAMVIQDINNNKKFDLSDVISSDLFQQNHASIKELNSWEDGDTTFISAVGNRSLITGYLFRNTWYTTYNIPFSYDITDMKVVKGNGTPYATWYNPELKQIIVALYNNKTTSTKKWLEIENLPFMKGPQLILAKRVGNASIVESLLLGTVNNLHNYFQLYRINDLSSSPLGPIISDWNENYSIAHNSIGQIVYVRADYNSRVIFAGLNFVDKWESIQSSTPPEVNIHPQSKLSLFFLNDNFTVTIMKRSEGSIYVLGGIG